MNFWRNTKMQTDVELQNPFSYSFLLTAILIGLAVLPVIIYLIVRLIHFKPAKKPAKPKPAPVYAKPNLKTLKQMALAEINRIAAQHDAGEISDREAYVKLSMAVRDFVNRAEENNVSNMTLEEIKKLNLPKLESLIEQFYRPEFSYEGPENNIRRAFEDARTVVSEWN